jgi:hypothetical protein
MNLGIELGPPKVTKLDSKFRINHTCGIAPGTNDCVEQDAAVCPVEAYPFPQKYERRKYPDESVTIKSNNKMKSIIHPHIRLIMGSIRW